MFNSITGILTQKNIDTICIDTHGIEWEIYISKFSLQQLPEIGKKVTVFIWLYHRDDTMRLFGFSTRAEKHMFLDLMKVNGIGVKQGQKILSHISPTDLENALETTDLNRLTAIPGLGKKTAQKMILTLKGQLTESNSKLQSANSHPFEDIIQALVNMGYERKQAITSVDTILAQSKQGTKEKSAYEDDIFRRAIILLSQGN